MIVSDTIELRRILDEDCTPGIVMTSGGFDPMHVGHLRCILESSKIAKDNGYKLVVVVNGDGFLARKKGYAFMDVAERMEIIDGIKGVDYVTTWDDGSQVVSGAVLHLRPSIFTKGGDRTDRSNIPEYPTCDAVGCDIITGVGGGKIQSSSDLVAKVKNESGN